VSYYQPGSEPVSTAQHHGSGIRFEYAVVPSAELSPRTFWNFAGEYSSFRRQRAATGERRDLADGSAVSRATARSACLGTRLKTHGSADPGGRLSVIGQPRR
jgi:hypothetical protein